MHVSLLPSGDRAWAASGRAGGRKGQSPPAVHRQHQVHRWAFQAEDADWGHHAWLCCQATEEPRRRVAGVPVQAAHHHREGPGLWEGQGEAKSQASRCSICNVTHLGLQSKSSWKKCHLVIFQRGQGLFFFSWLSTPTILSLIIPRRLTSSPRRLQGAI